MIYSAANRHLPHRRQWFANAVAHIERCSWNSSSAFAFGGNGRPAFERSTPTYSRHFPMPRTSRIAVSISKIPNACTAPAARSACKFMGNPRPCLITSPCGTFITNLSERRNKTICRCSGENRIDFPKLCGPHRAMAHAVPLPERSARPCGRKLRDGRPRSRHAAFLCVARVAAQ